VNQQASTSEISPEPTAPDVKAYLWISDFDEDPDEISRRLGIEPSETNRAGDAMGQSPMRRRRNSWRLDSTVDAPYDVEKHALAILDRVAPAQEAVRELAQRCSVELKVVIYANTEQSFPGLSFTRETLRRIADLAADLDIDVYVT
jgi:hypothetical protein